MSTPLTDPAAPPAIRSPLKLLYWIFFRGLALRRYAQSIGQRSAAPLAGVWRVEDREERQVPGTLRTADPWSGRSRGSPQTSEGCGLPGCP